MGFINSIKNKLNIKINRQKKAIQIDYVVCAVGFFYFFIYFGGWGLRLWLWWWLWLSTVVVAGVSSDSGFVSSERDVNENKK